MPDTRLTLSNRMQGVRALPYRTQTLPHRTHAVITLAPRCMPISLKQRVQSGCINNHFHSRGYNSKGRSRSSEKPICANLGPVNARVLPSPVPLFSTRWVTLRLWHCARRQRRKLLNTPDLPRCKPTVHDCCFYPGVSVLACSRLTRVTASYIYTPIPCKQHYHDSNKINTRFGRSS